MIGYIYFIQQLSSKNVKIGYTINNPFERLSEIQVGASESLSIVGCIHGDRNLEQSLHKLYSHFKIRGEWFSKDVLKILDSADQVDIEFLRKQFLVPKKSERVSSQDEPLYFHYNMSVLFHGKNLSEIARKFNISKSLLADWVADRRTPSAKNFHHVKKLANHVGLTFEQIFFEKYNGASK